MVNNLGRSAWALVLTILMVLPAIPASPGGDRAVPDITINVTTLSNGNTTGTATLDGSAPDQSLALGLPNGATVLSAKMNVTGVPLTAGGRDYPRNVTVDLGPRDTPEWAFMGKGYGDLGHQTMFVSGSDNSSMVFGMNATNSTYFYLPQGAEILSANCTLNGSSSSNVTIQDPAAGSTNVYPFGSGGFRFQWLYLGKEVGSSGMLDKAAWKVQPNYLGASSTLSNFKMLLCNTTVTALTGDFNGNYGGATPMKVMDTASLQISESGGWVELDPPDDFFYDGSKSLLIEVDFSARVGGSFGLKSGSLAGETGARRAWGSSGASSGSVDGNAYRYDCKLNFISKMNMEVDMCNDTIIDYTNSTTPWAGTNLVFTEALGEYMETAPVSFTDKYGNTFVSVPLKLYMEFAGRMIFSGLSVTYRWTGTVDEVKNIGNLADALSDLLPTKYDGKYSNISIAISSETPGKVRISGISIVFRPPVHPPFIDSSEPGQQAVTMNENETQVFTIEASDEYGYPLTPVWYLDTLEAGRDRYNFSYSADFESAGMHTLSVSVNNTMRSVTASWTITVLNVNRPPVVASFYPESEISILEEESILLGLVGADPDTQDRELKYNWYVGSVDQGVSGDTFRFVTSLTSAGVASIRAKVTDSGGLSASRSWKVTVVNVNVAPVVDKLAPNLNPTIQEMQSALFSVTASDFDKQLLKYTWLLDGAEAGLGQQYAYRPGYDAAGVHKLEVVISDGETNISRSWTVTVENVNRPPAAVIDSPAGKLDFLDTELINFSAASSSDPDGDALRFRWFEGARDISSERAFEKRFSPGVHELTLEVTDANRAVNRATVKFTVHYIKLVPNIDRDPLFPVEGDRLTFTVWVNNTGDANATAVEIELQVDSVSVGRHTIDSIAGGGAGSTSFGWKAKKGEHVLTVKIGGASTNSTVEVEEKPVPPAMDMTLPIIVVVVAVIAGVAGGLGFAMSRKKGK